MLLKFRLRSENELHGRLKKKKFAEPAIRKAIDFLKEKRFIDDAVFASAWVDARLKKGMGPRRIARELAFKGIDKRLIEGELARIKEDYPEDETALEIALRKKEKMKDIDPQKMRQRIYGYLIRRGFSPDTVIGVLNEL